MNTCKMAAVIATVLMTSGWTNLGRAQVAPEANAPSAAAAWQSDKVIYVAGLLDVKPNSAGSLSLTKTGLVFANKDAGGTILFDQITAVSIGDERVATGGTGAKVARMIPIYGFGSAMGAVTNKLEDLLTIEYRDKDGGYHGAVFEVPKTQAALAQQQLAALTTAPAIVAPKPCSGLATPNTILVEPIQLLGIDLPAEYRVLLYEQLVAELRLSNSVGTVYRAGDASASCAAKRLLVSVTAFKKGNEAVRAATGPVGFFVGATSVKFDVSLVDHAGAVLFEKSLTTKKHGDGDSLNVARDLAKSVSKRLKKAKQMGPQSAS